MGSLLSSTWALLFGQRSRKLLILGLNNAGKTSILYALQLNRLVPTQPTIGGNAEEFSFKNLSFIAWDLGGQETFRESWNLYYKSTDAVIFVVDSSEPGRFSLAKKELHLLMQHPELSRACVLVFANKQDIQGAIPVEHVIEALDLRQFGGRAWTVQPCSAVTQHGLSEGMQWVAEHMCE